MSDDRPIMQFAFPLNDWYLWFAWYPVKTWDERWRWMCWVERRLLQTKEHLTPPTSTWWQYRILKRKPDLPYPFGNGPFI